jgi:rod shape-determining protein MreB
MHADTHRLLAVGEEAKRMIGRTPHAILAVRPLKDGVIADFDTTEVMLKHFIARVQRRRSLLHPGVLVGVASGVTEVEARAVKDAALRAGARHAGLIEEPMAGAIGAGLPVGEATGSMIVDIGGGTTEVAVIALGAVVTSRSIRIAGDEMDQAIVAFLRREVNLLVGERTAEELKIAIGSACPQTREARAEARGRDLVSGLPRCVVISSGHLREAMAEPLAQIVETVKSTLEQAPPELAADISHHGIHLVGGGALLRGMDRLVARETGIPVKTVADPVTAVVAGTGRVLENPDLYRGMLNGSIS